MAKGDHLEFDLDAEDLKLFTDEAEEQLDVLDAALVEMEGEPDPDLLQRIFRAAHTLKGSSATIGHTRMARLTHAMETVLDAVRQGQAVPNAGMVDKLLQGLDVLRILTVEVSTGIESGAEIETLEVEILATLANAGSHETPKAPAPETVPTTATLNSAAAELARRAAHEGKSVFHVLVTIEQACQLPSIRCFQVLQELEALAAIIWMSPERDQVEAGNSEFSLEAVVATNAGDDEVRAALTAVMDIAAATLEPFEVAPEDPETWSTPDASGALVASGHSPQPIRIESRKTAKTSSAESQASRPGGSVRIEVERLEGLMNLVGELVIDRSRLQQIRSQLSGMIRGSDMADLSENFEETINHLARITDELQDEIMRSRMLPIKSVLTRLPRLVRDVASRCGKKVDLVTSGEETKLDRSVIEEISDPLVHVLRNAIDHGIESPERRRELGKPESGTVTITAWNQETYIYLSIKDDGQGLDTATLRRKVVENGLVSREMADAATEEQAMHYVFYAGLSTAKQLSDVSGRGVGMDIVRTNIERLNGTIEIHSEPGKGSEFIIQLPLTLATTKALMVVSNGVVYALPLVSVTEALAESQARIQMTGGSPTLVLRDALLPVVDLADAVGDRRERTTTGERYVVAASFGKHRLGLMVDSIIGEQDVVVKSLGGLVGKHHGVTGATILGDGSLGLIIDTASLVGDGRRSVPAA
jgi:two-component system chemotaxis sensor kinase CheA